MIEVQDTALAENAFEDAIEATVFMATVHVREGELGLPERIRAHLADGPVVVHLVRGEHDVAVHEATLTSRSTLTGIEWPDDVQPRTSLTVLCPRGGASHDIGVLLPDLNVDWPDEDLPAMPEPEPQPVPESEDEHEDAKPEHADDCTGCGGPGIVPCAADEVIGVMAFRDGWPIKDLGAPTEQMDAVLAAEQTVIAADFGAIVWPAEEPTPVEEEPTAADLAALEVVDLDRDYRPRWRRAAAFVQANWTNARATYIAATSGTFVGSLVTWLVTR